MKRTFCVQVLREQDMVGPWSPRDVGPTYVQASRAVISQSTMRCWDRFCPPKFSGAWLRISSH